jgi:hypothetical protein
VAPAPAHPATTGWQSVNVAEKNFNSRSVSVALHLLPYYSAFLRLAPLGSGPHHRESAAGAPDKLIVQHNIQQ